MKMIITGANGLLGQKLCMHLAGMKEVEVLATGRGPCRLSLPKGISYLSMDISNPEEVNAIMDEFQADSLIHTAAMTHVDQCLEDKEACRLLNVRSVEYLVEACNRWNTLFVFLSTDFIFDGAQGPYDEEAETAPVNFYGETKLDAEQVLIRSAHRWAIARTILVYGLAEDLSRSNIILWVKNSLDAGKEIQVVNDQWRTPTLAEDLADGCVRIALQEKQGIFNIGGKDFLSPYEMALATARHFKLDEQLIKETDGSRFSQPAKRPPKTGLIIDKARKELGYEPRSFQEGLQVMEAQLKARQKG